MPKSPPPSTSTSNFREPLSLRDAMPAIEQKLEKEEYEAVMHFVYRTTALISAHQEMENANKQMREAIAKLGGALVAAAKRYGNERALELNESDFPDSEEEANISLVEGNGPGELKLLVDIDVSAAN